VRSVVWTFNRSAKTYKSYSQKEVGSVRENKTALAGPTSSVMLLNVAATITIQTFDKFLRINSVDIWWLSSAMTFQLSSHPHVMWLICPAQEGFHVLGNEKGTQRLPLPARPTLGVPSDLQSDQIQTRHDPSCYPNNTV
jgi:hypothetical protein